MDWRGLIAEFLARLVVVCIGFVVALVPVAAIVAMVRLIIWLIEG